MLNRGVSGYTTKVFLMFRINNLLQAALPTSLFAEIIFRIVNLELGVMVWSSFTVMNVYSRAYSSHNHSESIPI